MMTADNGNGTGPAVEAVRLRVDENVLTIDDLCALEGDEMKSIVRLRGFLGRFVVGPDNAFLPEEQGRAVIGKMSVAQLRSTIQAFSAQVKEQLAINPTSAAKS